MKLQYRTKPYPHQVPALKHLLKHRGGGLQIPMRYGKSWIAVNFAGALYLKENVRRVLVVTVTSGLGVWEAEIGKHMPLGIPFAINDEPGAGAPDPLQFVIVNFQNTYDREMQPNSREWFPVNSKKLTDFAPELVIADESHNLGNPSSVQSKMCHRLGRRARFRVILTGSMFERQPFYVFGQAKFYDDGASLGSSFEQYKKKIALFGGYGNYEVIKYRNLKWMIGRMKRWTYIEKYVPLREPVNNELTFHLTGRNLATYAAMLKDSVVQVGAETVTASIVLTRHLRLMQIAGGFLRTDSGYKSVGTDKLKICEDRLTEYRAQGIEKAVIGCRFLPELVAVARLAQKLGFLPVLFHGGVKKGSERTRRIARFNESKRPALFISQIAAGKESINLSSADTMMFYSLSESYVDHHQFSKRIEVYNETRTLQYDFLLGHGTQDMLSYRALSLKKDVAEYIVENPDLVERIFTLEQRKKVTE